MDGGALTVNLSAYVIPVDLSSRSAPCLEPIDQATLTCGSQTISERFFHDISDAIESACEELRMTESQLRFELSRPFDDKKSAFPNEDKVIALGDQSRLKRQMRGEFPVDQ